MFVWPHYRLLALKISIIEVWHAIWKKVYLCYSMIQLEQCFPVLSVGISLSKLTLRFLSILECLFYQNSLKTHLSCASSIASIINLGYFHCKSIGNWSKTWNCLEKGLPWGTYKKYGQAHRVLTLYLSLILYMFCHCLWLHKPSELRFYFISIMTAFPWQFLKI